MASTGRFSPSPETYGGGPAALERLYAALRAARGTGYTGDDSSLVDAENEALARVLLTRMQAGKLIAREVLQELEAREVPLFEQHIRYLTRYEGFTTPEFLDEYRNVYREVRADL